MTCTGTAQETSKPRPPSCDAPPDPVGWGYKMPGDIWSWGHMTSDAARAAGGEHAALLDLIHEHPESFVIREFGADTCEQVML